MGATKRKSGFASRIGRPLLAGALAAGAAAPVPAAADVFLKLSGVPGESTDEKHKGEIQLVSYTQTFSNAIKFSAGSGANAGVVTCGAVTALKSIDRSSPFLIRLVVTGLHVPNGVITFRTVSTNPLEYYKITMFDVMVTAVEQTDNPDPATIIEKVSMVADKFQFEYTATADGKFQTTKFGWDCTTNKPF